MGTKEEMKANILEEIVVAKKAARPMTGTEDLLNAMSNEDAKPEIKKAHKTRWQRIVVACCCIVAVGAAGKGFLFLHTEVGAVQSAIGLAVKDLGTLKAQLATTDTKERLAAATAEVEGLKAANTRLRAEVKEIRDTLEALKARKNNVGPAQARPKRR